MSTRACYTFTEYSETSGRNDVHVYKHHDNYPEGGLQFIQQSIPYAWELPRFEADDFAAAFVAANKGTRGGGVRLINTKHPWEFSMDSEYWYKVSCKNGILMVDVFTVDWWGPEKKETLKISGTLSDAIKQYVSGDDVKLFQLGVH